MLGFHKNCAGLARAKYVRIDVYVRSVSLWPVLRDVLQAYETPCVRDDLLFVLIRALYCASRRREDEPKCVWVFFFGVVGITSATSRLFTTERCAAWWSVFMRSFAR